MKKSFIINRTIFLIVILLIWGLQSGFSQCTADASTTVACTDDEVQLFGTPNPSTKGLWTTPGGSRIHDPTKWDTYVTILDEGENKFIWTVTLPSGVTCSAVVTIWNYTQTADAGENLDTCSVVELHGNNPKYGSGLWELIAPTGEGQVINDATNPITQVTNLAPGSNTFKWTITSAKNNCKTSANVIITNTTPKSVSAGSNRTVCGGSVLLGGSEPGTNETGKWSVYEGYGDFEDKTLYNSHVTSLVQGTNIFRWAVTSYKGCIDSALVTLKNDSVYADAGQDITVCSDVANLLGNSAVAQGASGEWTSSGTGISFGNKFSSLTEVSGLQEKENEFEWTITKGKCSQVDVVEVMRVVAKAGEDQTVCSSEELTLTANVPYRGTGEWSVSGGGASGVTILNPTNNVTKVSGLKAGVTTFRWSITANTGTGSTCVVSDEVSVKNDSVTSSAGDDQSVCDSKVKLDASDPIVGTGEWTTGTGTYDPTDNQTSVTGLTPGLNTFVWSVTHNLCVKHDTVVVYNNDFTVSAGNDRTVCSVSELNPLNGTDPETGTGYWSVIYGNATFADKSLYNTSVTSLQHGVDSLVWHVTRNDCPKSDTIRILNDSVTLAYANADRTVCDGTVELSGNNPVLGTGEWTGPGGFTSTDNSISFTGLNPGNNNFRWTISSSHCSSYDEVDVLYEKLEVNAGEDRTICSTTEFSLSGTDPGFGGRGEWTHIGGVGPAVFENSTDHQTSFLELGPGKNTFRWTIYRNTCTAWDDVVWKNDSVSVAIAGDDQTVCDGTAILNATVPTPVIGTGEWTDGAGNYIANTNSTSVSNLPRGKNTFIWTIKNGNCQVSDTVYIYNNAFNVNAGAEQEICSTGELNPMNATDDSSLPGYGFWSPGSPAILYEDINSPNTHVYTLNAGTNILTWTVVKGGCTMSDEVIIQNDSVYAYANVDRTVCANTKVELDGNTPIDGSTGEWWFVEKNKSIGTSPTVDVTADLEHGTNTFIWTVSNARCSESDDVVIYKENLDVTAGSDKTICSTADFSLNASSPGTGGVGRWTRINSQFGSPYALSKSTCPQSKFTLLGPGWHDFEWTVERNGCTTSDVVRIQNDSVTVADAGPDDVTCLDNYILNGNQPNTTYGESGEWTDKNPTSTIVFDDVNMSQTKISNLKDNENTLVWTISKGNCSSSDEVKIQYDGFTFSAGPDQTICDVTGFKSDVPFISGATGFWTVSTGVTMADPSAYNSELTAISTVGPNILTWTYQKNNCEYSDAITVHYNEVEAVINTNSKVVCDDQVVLNAALKQPGIETGEWVSNYSEVTFSPNANAQHVTADNLRPDDNEFAWVVHNGNCVDTAKITITNHRPYVVDAGSDVNYSCHERHQLNAVTPTRGTGRWHLIGGSATFANPDDPSTWVDVGFDDNVLEWRVTYHECTIGDRITINNSLPDPAIINLSMNTPPYIRDTIVVCTDTINLSAVPVHRGIGTWTITAPPVPPPTPSATIVDPHLYNSGVYDLPPGTSEVWWTTTHNGCTLHDRVFIKNLNIPSSTWDMYQASGGSDMVICRWDTTMVIAPNTQGFGRWTVLEGSATFDEPNSYSSYVYDIHQGTNTLRWTVEHETLGCIFNSDRRVINASPDSAQIQTAAQTICTDHVALQALSPTIGTGHWSAGSGTAQFSNPNGINTGAFNFTFGKNTITWITQHTGTYVLNNALTIDTTCYLQDTVFMTYGGFDINATAYYNSLPGTDVCDEDLLKLHGEVPNPNTGFPMWETIAGGAKVLSSNDFITGVQNLSPGEGNTFRYTYTNVWKCKDEVDIDINNRAVHASADPNETICQDYVSLRGYPYPTQAGETGVWTQISGSGNLASTVGNQATFTDILRGKNEFQWRYSDGFCSDSVVVVIKSNDVVPYVNIETARQTVCVNSIELKAESPSCSGCSGEWDLLAGAAPTTSLPDNTNPLLVEGLQENALSTFKWTVTSDLDGLHCDAFETIDVFYAKPTTAYAGDDETVCVPFNVTSGTYTLKSKNDPNPGSIKGNGYWTQVPAASPGVTIVNSTDVTTPVTGLVPGQIYTFRWAIGFKGCESADTVAVRVVRVEANAGKDTLVCSDNGIFLNAINKTGQAGGEWKYLGTDPNVSIASPTTYISSVSNLPIGVSNFEWKVSQDGCEHTDQMLITNREVSVAKGTINAGADETVCRDQNELEDISGNSIPAGGTGVWSLIDQPSGTGAITFVSNTTNETSISGLEYGDYELQWSITNSYGCTGYDTVVIHNDYVPAEISTLTPLAVCKEKIKLFANNPFPGIGTWSTVSSINPAPIISDPNNQETDAALNAVTNEFKWTINTNGCITSDNITITNNSYTVSTVVTDPISQTGTSVCSDHPTIEATVVDGDGNVIDIPSSGGTWKWSVFAGNVVSFTPDNEQTTLISGLQQGPNKLKWRSERLGCVDSALVEIYNNSVDAYAYPGESETVCKNTTILHTNLIEPTETGTWTVVGGTGSMPTPVNPTTYSVTLSAGNNQFEWTVSNVHCSASDIVLVKNNEFNVNARALDEKGIPQEAVTVCTSGVTLDGKYTFPFAGTPDSMWWSVKPTGPVFNNSTFSNAAVSNLSNIMDNTFTWTVSKDGCSFSDDVVVKYFDVIANITIPEENKTVCESSVNLTADDPAPGTGLWTSKTAHILSPSKNLTQAIDLKKGRNVFIWTATRAQCSDVAFIEIENRDFDINPSASPYTACHAIPSIQANMVGQNINGNGVWTVEGGGTATIWNSTNFLTTVHDLEFGDNTFKWTFTNTDGCTHFNSITIQNDSCVSVNAGEDVSVCFNNTSLNGSLPCTGLTGTWTSPTGATIDEPSDRYSDVYLNMVENDFVWTFSKNGCTVSDEVTITNNSYTMEYEVYDPSTNITYPNATTYTVCIKNPTITAEAFDIQGTKVTPLYSNWQWQRIGGDEVTIVSETNPKTQITGLDAGVGTKLQWTATINGCNKSGTVDIFNNSFAVNAGNDQTICSSTTTLKPVTGGNGVWSSIFTGNIDHPTRSNTTVSNLAQGTHTFVWTISQNGCTASDEVEIFNASTDPAIVEANKTVCTNNSTLTATAINIGKGKWIPQGTAAVIADEFATSTSVTGLELGDNVFVWRVTNKGWCPVDTTVVITNNIVAANAGSSVEVCGTEATVSAAKPAQGSGVWTALGSTTASIEHSTSRSTLVRNLKTGPNKFKWTVSLNKCSAEDYVFVYNNTPTTADAGEDQSVCNNEVLLTGNDPVTTGEGYGGVGYWTKTFGGNATIANSTAISTNVSNLENNETYKFTWTIAKGKCSVSDEVSVRSISVAASAGTDRTVCSNISYLAADPPGNKARGHWTGDAGVIENANSNYTPIHSLNPGENKFTWTVTEGICSVADEVSINNRELSAAAGTIFAGFDRLTDCASTGEIPLNAYSKAGTEGLWSIESAIGSPVITSPTKTETTVTGIEYGTYEFKWSVHYKDDPDCPGSDNVVIKNNYCAANAGADFSVCENSTKMAADVPCVGLDGYWTYTSVSSGAPVIDASSSNTTSIALNSKTNNFKWTVKNTACGDSDDNIKVTNNWYTVEVTVTDGTNAVSDYGNVIYTVCSENPQLSVKVYDADGLRIDESEFTSWQWSNPNGSSVGITAPNNPTSGITGLSNKGGGAGLRWTAEINGCPKSGDFKIRNNRFDVNAGIDQSVCGTTATLEASTKDGQGVWKNDFSTGKVSHSTQAITEVTNLNPLSNTFTWIVEKNGCSSSDIVEIYNATPSEARINTDDETICTDVYTIQAEKPLIGTGVWTRTGTTAKIANENETETDLSALQFGTNYFLWTVTNGKCSSVDTVIITNSAVVSAVVENTVEVCENSTTISANPPGITGKGSWHVAYPTSGGASITSSLAENTKVTGLVSGLNTFVWTVRSNNNECSATATVDVTNNEPTEAAIAVSGYTVCPGEVLNLRATNIPNSSDGETGYWRNLTSYSATIHSADNYVTDISNLQLGTGGHQFSWAITRGNCVDSVIINVRTIDIVAKAGDDKTVCSSSSRLYSPVALKEGTGVWKEETGTSVVIASSNNAASDVSNLQQGVNKFSWTVSEDRCSVSDVVSINNREVLLDLLTDRDTVCRDIPELSATDLNPHNAFGSGSWSTVEFNTPAVFTAPDSAVTQVSNLRYGKNTFRWTYKNTDNCPASATIVVQNDSCTTLDAGANRAVCEDVIHLDAFQACSNSTGHWTKASDNTSSISSPNVHDSEVRLGKVYNSFTWTVTKNTCAVSDEVVITNNSYTVDVVVKDKDNGTEAHGQSIYTVCSENPIVEAKIYDREGNKIDSSLISSWVWSNPIGSSITILNSTNIQTGITGLSNTGGGAGLRWTASVNGCSKSGDVKLRNNSFPVNAGANQTVCSTTTTLEAFTGGSGEWRDVFSSGKVSQPAQAKTTVTGLNTLLNTFEWVVTKNGCTSRDTVEILNASSSPAKINSSDETICGSTISLQAEPPLIGTGVWAKLGTTAIIVDETNTTTDIDSLQQGDNKFYWKVTNNGLCPTADTVVIRNNLVVSSVVENSIEVCEDQATIMADAPLAGTGSWSLTYPTMGTLPRIQHSTHAKTAVTDLPSGLNTFTWTVVNGKCSSAAQVNVTNNEPTKAAIAVSSYTVCPGDVLKVEAENAPNSLYNETGYWRNLTSYSATIHSANHYITDISNLQLGIDDYQFSWTITRGDCVDSTEIDVRTINIVAEAEKSKTVCSSTSSLFSPTPSAEGTGVWSKKAGGTAVIASPNNPASNVSNLKQGVNTFYWTVSKSICSVSDVVTIDNREVLLSLSTDHATVCNDIPQLTAKDLNPHNTFASGSWSTVDFSTSAVFTAPDSAVTQVSNLLYGKNTFRWTYTNTDNCTASATIEIQNDSCKTVNAGADRVVCVDSTYLDATPACMNSTGHWTKASGNAIVR